jgi:hypothetical protein
MARNPANERASERVRIGAPATLKWGDQELSGFVEVVNTAGMFVASSRAPEIGDYVELVFSLPKRPGFGARFERPPVTLLDAIRNHHKEH